jgi:manganese/iron transport system permease protein
VVVAAASGLAGVYASFWLDSAPAPTIVLILTGVFLLALVWQGVRQRQRVSV